MFRYFFKVRTDRLIGSCYVDVTHRDDLWILSSLWVTPSARGLGHGRELLGKVLTWADDNESALFLVVEPFGDATGPDQVGLQAFYEEHGFVVWPENPVYMVRWGVDPQIEDEDVRETVSIIEQYATAAV